MVDVQFYAIVVDENGIVRRRQLLQNVRFEIGKLFADRIIFRRGDMASGSYLVYLEAPWGFHALLDGPLIIGPADHVLELDFGDAIKLSFAVGRDGCKTNAEQNLIQAALMHATKTLSDGE